MQCKSAKEVWEKLNKSHEGDDKSKQSKLQTFKLRFERLRINEEEIIPEYFLRVNEVTNMIIRLGEDVKEEVVVHKVLRSFPMRFNAKISAIKEMTN